MRKELTSIANSLRSTGARPGIIARKAVTTMKIKHFKRFAAIMCAAAILTGCGNNSKGLEFSYKKNDYVRYDIRIKSPVNIVVLETTYDSEGGVHVKGDEDRYYTDEEKAAREAALQKRIELQKELFSRLEGTWESESGDSFTVYQENDEYCLKVVLDGVEMIHAPVWFRELPSGNYSISFDAGAMEGEFQFEMSEDGNALDYFGESFKRK